MHSLAHHPSVRRPMSLQRRRALVIVTYLGFTLFLVALYAGYAAVPRWPFWLGCTTIVLFAATAAAFIALVRAPGYAADVLDARLDEGQQQVRDHAYRFAYYGLTVLFGVLSLVLMYAAGSNASWQSIQDMALLLPWLTFLPGSLPTAVVAWTEPDLPVDF